jgi:hypothetical protein
MAMALNIRLASRQAAPSPPSWRALAKAGTKAEESAPSATRSLKKLGSLKATKNASEIPEAPKRWAETISRTNPNTRDTTVAMLIKADDLLISPLFSNVFWIPFVWMTPKLFDI